MVLPSQTRCPCCDQSVPAASSRWLPQYLQCPRCQSCFVWPRATQEEQIRRFEDAVAQETEHVRFSPDPDYRKDTIDLCLEHLARLRGRRSAPGNLSFLDYGCGAGRLLFAAQARSFGRVVGFDVSPMMLDKCQENFNFRGICCDSQLARLAPYDLIFSEDVLEHCIEPIQTLSVIHSCLAEDGVFHAQVPLASGVSARLLGQAWWVAAPQFHIQLFHREAFRSALEQCGFRLLSFRIHSVVPWLRGKAERSSDRAFWFAYKLTRSLEKRLRFLRWGDYCDVVATKHRAQGATSQIRPTHILMTRPDVAARQDT